MTEVSYQAKPWLKHYADGVPGEIKFEELCIPGFLERSAKRYPDHDAILFKDDKMSYKELKDKVDRLATCLSDFGIKKGDSVAILLPNLIPLVIGYYAIQRIGAIGVMSNPMYSDLELEYQFKDSGARAVITMDIFGDRMIDLRPKTGIKQIIYTSVLGVDVKPAEDVYKWEDILSKTSPNPPTVDISFDDVAQYQYTGGTTGVSKGVMLTQRNLSCNVQQMGAWLTRPSKGDLKEGKEINMCAAPYFHAFGLTIGLNMSIYMGWAQILIPQPKPDPLIEAIRKFKPTAVLLVPTMYLGVLSHPDFDKVDMKSIKFCGSGASALPVEVIEKMEKKTGSPLMEGYGGTELSPVSHANPFHGLEKPGSVGIPLPNTLARIVDLNDGERDVPVGEVGEIVIQGPQVMKGYLNMPGETAEALKGGWFHSGDIGKMDGDGYFYVVDRKKDMVISGGYNVYPKEIEDVYIEHPKVAEVAAIGVSHPTRGEQVKLVLVLKEGETATEEDMIKYCRDKLAKYKWPTTVEFRSELPKSAVGKILKHVLCAEKT
ncbi:MAG: long-chain fatty acid--CoA ligase [Dehalococcoidia bacterium]